MPPIRCWCWSTGRSIYDDVQGQVFWKGIPVTLPEIKRIEVLKGPAGALYGFNAFDGVINIITKSPEEMKGTTLQFGGGEFGTITAAAIEAGTVGKLGYRLSAGRDQNNQWRNRDALAFRSHKFNVQTEYGLPGDSKLQVSGGLVDMNRFDGPTFEDVTFDTKPQQGYATLVERHAAQLEFTTLPPPFPSPPPIMVRGSQSLLPEKIISYEAEYQGWFFRHRLRTRAALFFNHISDLISPTTFGPVITFANGGIADIYGGEAGIEFLAKSWLTGFANYSYEEVGQSFTGDSQRSAPRFKFNLGLRGEWENGFSGEAALYHVGATTFPISGAFAAFSPFGVLVPDTRVGSYNLLNLRAGYRFWHEKAELAISVFNALNDRHKETLSATPLAAASWAG